MQQPEPHPIPHLELKGTVLGVVVASSVFLSLEQARPDLLEKLVTVGEEGVDDVGACRPGLIGQQCRRGPAVYHRERRGAERRVV